MPVPLCILFLIVGRWAGLSMAGVGMPDHFLVRVRGVRPVLVDPFHKGRSVTKVDCVRYLRSVGYGNAVVEHLRNLEDREVIGHLLRSLKRVYRELGDREVENAIDDALGHIETCC